MSLRAVLAALTALCVTTGCTGRTVPPEPPAPEATGGLQVVPTPNAVAPADEGDR